MTIQEKKSKCNKDYRSNHREELLAYGENWRSAHRESLRQDEHIRRVDLKHKGICIQCRNKADPKSTRCRKCKDRLSSKARALRSKRLQAGLCYQCGKEPVAGGKYGLQ